MYFLKKAIETIFSPLGITVILVGAGIVLSFAKRRSQIGRRFLISGGLLFLVLLFSPLSEYLVLGLERGYPPMLNPPKSPKIDRIVVLAGYAEEHSGFPVTATLTEQTICSCSEGLRLYRLLPGAKLILSGGIVRARERPVAASMSEYLQQMGVPAQDIIVEGKSETTFENMREVRKLVGSSPFILVAQACDMRRATAVARKLQMNSIAAPACHWVLQYHTNTSTFEDIKRHLETILYPSAKNLSRIQWAYHEYAGFLWYRLLGRV
jgi:uncharacterized SAM-binding protein YcdF (DUF218 family)